MSQQSSSRLTRSSSHKELRVYRSAFELAMELFHASKKFPRDERYELTSQARRSSRSVCANIAEAWRKRRYEGSFVSKLSDAETEAGEVVTWLEFAVECGYMAPELGDSLTERYEALLGSIIGMIDHSQEWIIPKPKR